MTDARFFDPDQPRDDGGRWTSGSAGDGSASKAHSALRKRESEIRNLDTHEVLFVVDKSGKVLLDKSGEPGADRVDVSEAERDTIRGGIATHNHRIVSSFSPEDVKFACDNRLSEVRVVDAKHTYTMSLPGGLAFTPGMWTDVHRAYVRHRLLARRESAVSRRAGGDARSASQADSLHATWEHVTRELGLRYSRE